jgi:hypothetical protein
MIAVVEVSSSFASCWTFSDFFAFEIAMSSLRYDRDQGSEIRDQHESPIRRCSFLDSPWRRSSRPLQIPFPNSQIGAREKQDDQTN